MSKDVKEAKKKIEMLVNHLIDSIDVDLLSDNQKIGYLKAVQQFVMPKMESIKQQTSLISFFIGFLLGLFLLLF